MPLPMPAGRFRAGLVQGREAFILEQKPGTAFSLPVQDKVEQELGGVTFNVEMPSANSFPSGTINKLTKNTH